VNLKLAGARDLVPVSISYRGRRVDVAVPAAVSVTEFLPGLVAQQGWLARDEATRGFELRTVDGQALDPSQSLTDQEVAPGSLLTLRALLDDDRGPVRYDDLVEAIGETVGASRAAWTQGDSVQLSSYTSAVLIVVAAALLFFSPTPRIVVVLATAAGALLVTLAAGVVARSAVACATSRGGAMALALTAPVLTGLLGAAALPGDPGRQLVASGVGALVGSAAVIALPRAQRSCAGGPGLVGLVLLLFGLGQWVWGWPTQRLGIALVAAISLAVLLLPWIGLARLPIRFEALTVDTPSPPGTPPSQADRSLDGAAVATQLADGDILVVSLRIGAGLSVLALTPLIVVTPLGDVFLLTVALGLLLGVRSLYGRAEVYVGFLAGAATLALAGVLTALRLPDLLPWLVGAAVLVAGLVVASNVIAVRLRPALSRAADALHLVALVAILPTAALAWGIF